MSGKLRALVLSVAVAALTVGYAGGATSIATAKSSASPVAAAAAVKAHKKKKKAHKKKAGPVVVIKARKIPGLGKVLVDAKGRTLYMFVPDKRKKVTCFGGCAAVWPPVVGAKAKGVDGVKNKLLGADSDSKVKGGKVITYNGWPLYTYITDTAPGAHTGQATDLNGGLWYVISTSGKVIKKK